MKKVVAFDLDGTLVNSVLHLMPAYHESLEMMNRPALPDETLRQCIGGAQMDNYKLLMPDVDWETYLRYELLVAENAAKYAKTHGQAYPRIKEALDALRARGYVTVLCSNGGVEYVLPLLDLLGLRAHLDHVQAIKTERNKTELLASLIHDFDCAGRVALVGDRHFDAEAARNNGAYFIGCHYGLFPEEIDKAKPDAVLENPLDLPQAVERLLGPAR